jgi:hypothetical protein
VTRWDRGAAIALAILLLSGLALPAQTPAGAEYRVYGEAPRLLLNQRHRRLIERECERQTMRWQSFAALVESHASFEEPGLAQALYGVAAHSRGACGAALAWASNAADPNKENDLRQMALVVDWCGHELDAERHTRLQRRILAAAPAHPRNFAEARSAVFAAIAAADVDPGRSATMLQAIVEQWWRRETAPRLEVGAGLPESRAELLALVELLHALFDNLHLDVRDDCPHWFARLPARLMLGYAPAPWRGGGEVYRVAADAAPDARESTWSRAAELALVAADPNARQAQFLQGWLMQDRFLLRTPLGAPYEFLWADPYLPGLSYTHMAAYDRDHGRLLVRSSWDDAAAWFGFAGAGAPARLLRDGQGATLDPRAAHPPLELGAVRVFFAASGLHFNAGWTGASEERAVEPVAFLIGLPPRTGYRVEGVAAKPELVESDEGGIVELALPPALRGRVRLLPMKPARRE